MKSSNKAVVKVMRPRADSESMAAHMKSVLEQLGEDPYARRTGADAGARGKGAALPDQRLRAWTSTSIVNGALFTQ